MTEERQIERGQVYYLRFDDSIGDEMGAGRAALIVSNNGDIKDLNTVIVVYVTTGLHKSKNVVKTIFNGRQQYIHCSQIRTLDKSRLSTYLGTLDPKTMMKVSNACALAMSYNSVVTVEKNDNTDALTELKVELDAYKKLYEKALEKLAELRFEKDTYEEELPIIPEVEEEELCEEPEPVVDFEPPELDLSALTEKFRQYDEQQSEKKNISYGSLNSLLREEKPQKKKKVVEREKPKVKVVKVNTAHRYDLENIGIKSQTAYKIIEYRIKNGNFRNVEDLLLVSGFGRKELNKYGEMLEI